MKNLSIIAAVAKGGAIGKNGGLLCHMSADLQRFKALTTGHTIVMGRRTFDSLPKGALPNRRNIVITRNPQFSAPGVEVALSVPHGRVRRRGFRYRRRTDLPRHAAVRVSSVSDGNRRDILRRRRFLPRCQLERMARDAARASSIRRPQPSPILVCKLRAVKQHSTTLSTTHGESFFIPHTIDAVYEHIDRIIRLSIINHLNLHR